MKQMKWKTVLGGVAILVLAGCSAAGSSTSTTAPTAAAASSAPPPSRSAASAPQPTATARPEIDPSTGEPVCYYTRSEGGGIEIVLQVLVVGATHCYVSALSEVNSLDPGAVSVTGTWKYATAPPQAAATGFDIGGCNGNVGVTGDNDTVTLSLIGPSQGATNNTPAVNNAASDMNSECSLLNLGAYS